MRAVIIVFIICIVQYNTAFAQTEDKKRAAEWGFLAADTLYWNDQKYIMEYSPLSYFAGYVHLYPELVGWYSGFDEDSNWKQNYYAIWILRGSGLYLQDIVFYENSDRIKKIFPRKERYKRMELLTKRKFKKRLSRIIPPESPAGSLYADWMNGVIHIKRTLSDFLKEVRPELEENYGEEWQNKMYDEWKRDVYQRLTFKNGKLSIEYIKPDTFFQKEDTIVSKVAR